MSSSKLRSVWFWARAAVEVVALTWSGGVLVFYGSGLVGALASPHSAEALVAVLAGMGLGLVAASTIIVRRATRISSRQDRDG